MQPRPRTRSSRRRHLAQHPGACPVQARPPRGGGAPGPGAPHLERVWVGAPALPASGPGSVPGAESHARSLRRGRTEGARNGRPPTPTNPGPQGRGSPRPCPSQGAHLAAGRRAPGRRVRARGRRAVPLNGPRRLPRAPRPPRCGPVLGAAGESPCEPERRTAGALPTAGRTGPAPAGTPTSRRPRVPPPHFPRTPRRARPRLPQCPSSRRAPPAELAGGVRAWGGARPGRAAPRPAERGPGLRASPLLPGFSGRSGH